MRQRRQALAVRAHLDKQGYQVCILEDQVNAVIKRQLCRVQGQQLAPRLKGAHVCILAQSHLPLHTSAMRFWHVLGDFHLDLHNIEADVYSTSYASSKACVETIHAPTKPYISLPNLDGNDYLTNVRESPLGSL